VAIPIVVSLLLGGSFLLSRQHLRLDGRHVKERRDRDLTALVGPAYMARAADCDPALLEVYLRDFIEFTDRPGDWITANYCLAALHDPRVVTPLLDMLRPDEPPSPRDDLQIGSDPRQIMSQVRRAMTGGFGTRGTVQSVLARVGDAAVPELSEALEDSDPTVRHAAARALALRASEQSIEALVEAARHSRSDIRVSISSQLPSLACSRQLEVEEAFRLAEDFAADAEPDVRLNAVRGLVIFAGSRPRALLDELVNDPDPRVRAEAAELLE